MRRLAILLVPLALATGCSWTPHQRDPATIAAIDATARNSASDAARASSALDRAAEVVTGTASPEQRADEASALRKEAANVRALEAAEQARLSGWKFREGQKTP